MRHLKILSALVLVMVLLITLVTPAVACETDYAGTINVDGYNVYIDREGSGKVPVVFDSGWGDTGWVWNLVQPELAKVTQTLSFDRLGVVGEIQPSKSDFAPDVGKTAVDRAHWLHKIVAAANVKKPFIYVAHSSADINARVYADLYPDDIAGVIFVDAMHEDVDALYLQLFPPEMTQFYKDYMGSIEATYDDFVAGLNQARDCRDSLTNKPLTVIWSTKPDDGFGGILNTAWAGYQADLLTLSKDSNEIWLDQVGHVIQQERPDVVIQAINDMLAKVSEDCQ